MNIESKALPHFGGGAVSFSLSRLLGGAGENLPRERYQEPTLQQTSRGVWFIRPWVDVIQDGKLTRAKKTVTIGAMGKREAQSKAREVMQTINRADYVVTSQIRLKAFLEEYRRLHLAKLAAPSRYRYESALKNYIEKTFGDHMLCEINTVLVQKWLDSLEQATEERPALSWSSRTGLRNIMSSIFTKAREWGRWKDSNPIEFVHCGRRRHVREQRKLSDDDIRRLLAALPEDLRLACCVSLFCTLRISEVLGLQEKHLDWDRGVILVRQRYCRHDLDMVKSQRSVRDVPMGHLADDLKRLTTGDPERFVFQIGVKGRVGNRYKQPKICRDGSDLLHYFVRPAAKALGIYWVGFGFHAFRREAVTAMSAALGTNQAMRMAGHSTADMSLRYTLADQQAQDAAVRARQESLLGATTGKAN